MEPLTVALFFLCIAIGSFSRMCTDDDCVDKRLLEWTMYPFLYKRDEGRYTYKICSGLCLRNVTTRVNPSILTRDTTFFSCQENKILSQCFLPMSAEYESVQPVCNDYDCIQVSFDKCNDCLELRLYPVFPYDHVKPVCFTREDRKYLGRCTIPAYHGVVNKQCNIKPTTRLVHFMCTIVALYASCCGFICLHL